MATERSLARRVPAGTSVGPDGHPVARPSVPPHGIIASMHPRRIVRPPGTPTEGGSPLQATGPTLRWGVVSTGSIARTVTDQIEQLEDAELQAVSSRSPDRARAFAEEFGFESAYGDGDEPGYVQLAQDPDVDVAYVATPHGQHHQVVSALLEAGKHVLVEKAITVTAREAEELASLARARGRFLMEAVWTRFLPAFQRALDVLEAGELGEVRWVQGDLGFRGTADPRRRLWSPEDGGGAVLDTAVYPLTWVLAALGFPDGVRANGSLTEEGVDATCALQLSYGSGAQAQVVATLEAQATKVARIGGTEGTLVTDAPLTRPNGFRVHRGDDVREYRFTQTAPPYAYQLREVTRCIQEGLTESPTMPLDDSIATMRLFDEARRQLGVVLPHDAPR